MRCVCMNVRARVQRQDMAKQSKQSKGAAKSDAKRINRKFHCFVVVVVFISLYVVVIVCGISQFCSESAAQSLKSSMQTLKFII